MKRVIVIPAWNEGSAITPVVAAAVLVAEAVVVVDDGSTDDTGEAARRAGAIVVRHAVNRGLGGALGTGIAAALALGADFVVTMDADGQHRAEDAVKIFERLEKGDVDFVMGSRMLDASGNMPPRRRIANRVGNWLTWALFGTLVSDSQSGLRGLSRAAATGLDLRTNGMEVSSEFVKLISDRHWRWAEVAIPAIYTDYSLSKGQGFLPGIRTALKLVFRRFVG